MSRFSSWNTKKMKFRYISSFQSHNSWGIVSVTFQVIKLFKDLITIQISAKLEIVQFIIQRLPKNFVSLWCPITTVSICPRSVYRRLKLNFYRETLNKPYTCIMHDHVQNCLVCNGTVVPQLNAPGVSYFFFKNLTLPEDLLTNKGFSIAFSDSNVLCPYT